MPTTGRCYRAATPISASAITPTSAGKTVILNALIASPAMQMARTSSVMAEVRKNPFQISYRAQLFHQKTVSDNWFFTELFDASPVQR